TQENNDSEFSKRASFLQRGLFAAAHFDLLEHVQPLVSRLGKLIRAQQGGLTLQEVNRGLGKSFRSLRQMGQRDEIDYLLTQMDRTIREGQDIQGLDPARLADRWEAMVALLHVAGGYYYFGRGGQAEPVLRVAREILFKTGLANIRAKTEIARTYA